jgi:prevent-host-death family protein
MEKIVGLKELRENLDKYAKRVERGESLLVLKRSKPLFRISPPEEGNWEIIIDFTKIKRGGVKIKDLLSRL